MLLSRSSRRSDFAAIYPLQTRWMDNDQYGHMNNVVHYSLFDTAITNWQLDARVFDAAGQDRLFMVIESGCKYFAEAGYPDLIHAGLGIGHIGTTSWRYEIALFRNDEEAPFAVGFFAQVQVSGTTRKPVPLTEPMRQAFEQIKLG